MAGGLSPERQARRGKYVLYWMQASQRAECNHALEYAIREANRRDKPVVVFFGITESFPDANLRHYHFMLEGLRETRRVLRGRGIAMVVHAVSPEIGAVEMARDAVLLVMDGGYLRVQKAWRRHVAEHAPCPVVQVESDVIVPVEEASPKEEFSAATFRPKIRRKLGEYLVPLRESRPAVESARMRLASLDLDDVDALLRGLDLDRSVPPVEGFRGGRSHARRFLEEFIERKLDRFPDERNDPNAGCLSNMSPYLHFGQLSPLEAALAVDAAKSPGTAAYLEELIVRRELSMNFVQYNDRYDDFEGLPQWSRGELQRHARDRREAEYALEQLEAARTGDEYWNAAQDEMVCTGKMHGYMRMYWGKKIIEWVRDPAEAFRIALHLNNKYELDGRDANGFAGVAWCFGKHDRPWPPRAVLGKVRAMAASGLRRKFDPDAYVERIRRTCAAPA